MTVDPVGQPRQRRLGQRRRVVGRERLRGEVVGVGQLDRQHRVGHRDRQPGLVVDDRERLAPVALPRKQPVAQPVGDRALPAPCSSSQAMMVAFASAMSSPSRLSPSPAELIAGPVAGVAPCPPSPSGGCDGADDRQLEHLGEVPVALVLAGHGHDRAGAVTHQHVVGDEDRQLRAVDRVGRERAGEYAGLVAGRVGLPVHLRPAGRRAGGRPRPPRPGSRCPPVHGGTVPSGHGVGQQRIDQRVLGGQHHVGRAEQRVGTGGEDRDRGRCRSPAAKSMCAPVERPIQLRCISATCSGQSM